MGGTAIKSDVVCAVVVLGTFVASMSVMNIGLVSTGDLAGMAPVLAKYCGLLCWSRTGPVLDLCGVPAVDVGVVKVA